MRGDDFFLNMATRPPLTKLHPQVADFLKTYLRGEKAIPFGDRWVINTQFPPWPGRAFDNLVDHFLRDEGRRLYSVTLAVTNRCPFRCWHCYNAGRSPEDIPLAALKRLAFDFPRDGAILRDAVEQAGLQVMESWEGSAVFRYRTAREVLDHLLESGAGTVFYDAIDARVRDRLTGEFLSILCRRNGRRKTFEVKHDFLACIARKTKTRPGP